MNHQNHSNNAKKQKNFQMTKHLHRDLSTTNQKNRPFGFKTLCCNILWFLHTRSGVLSMILIPVHLPIRTSLTNAINFNTATFWSSTKRL